MRYSNATEFPRSDRLSIGSAQCYRKLPIVIRNPCKNEKALKCFQFNLKHLWLLKF